VIGRRETLGVKRECRESFEKEMNSERMGMQSDRTVAGARVFERYNVNLRSGKGAKWWSCD